MGERTGMGDLGMRWSDVSGLKIMDQAMRDLDPLKVRRAGAMALNRAGSQGVTQTRRAMARQTGLSQKLLKRAMKPIRASATTLEFLIRAKGGDISLKYFQARETQRGVSAKPFNHRRVFAGSFIKGGRFPGRVDLRMNGHVFKRTDADRMSIKKQRSGVIIPYEMVKDESGKAWRQTVGKVLPVRMQHELKRLTGRAFS
ncbi:MAG: phage tail protein [Roseibium sp.]|uniref:phage tail protein n=2 Tax=Roseibium sp. TaxID=1936156 RepID=UPI0032655215